MKSITKNVYSFKELIELNKEGKVFNAVVEKVRHALSMMSAETDIFNEIVIDDIWRSVLEDVGFINPDVRWSGFCSQGDGASFTSDCDIERLINWFTRPADQYLVLKLEGQAFEKDYELLRNHVDNINLKVIRNHGHYLHEKTCSVSIEFLNVPPDLDNIVSQFVQDVEKLRLDASRLIYIALRNEYDYFTSDEALIEFDDNNEYHWDLKGNRE